jgi:hypothetical protein
MTWGIAYLTRGYVRFAENTLLNSHFIDGNTGKGMYAHTHAVDISLGIGRRDSMNSRKEIANEAFFIIDYLISIRKKRTDDISYVRIPSDEEIISGLKTARIAISKSVMPIKLHNELFCPSCHAIVAKRSMYCKHCGQLIERGGIA